MNAPALLSSDWIWETDARHRFLHTPPRTSELTGYQAPHYVGKCRWEVEGLSPLHGDWAEHRAVLERHEIFRDLELVQVRADGTRCFLLVSGAPVFTPEGAFFGYRGTAKDVTRHKLTEEALRESEARLRSLVELSSDWFWEQDEQLRFKPGAATAQKNLLRGAQYVGKTRWEAVGASVDDPLWAAHKAQLERREPFRDLEYVRLAADGTQRWVSVSGEPVFDEHGAFRGYRGVGRDITARKRAELERGKIARAFAALSAANELVARAGSAEELLEGACRIAVTSGDFLFAVARRVEPESATTRLVAFAGAGHPERLKRPLDLTPGSPDEQSLMVRAFRSGRPVVVAGAAIDPKTFLGGIAEESGVRAGAAYPLMRNGECIGGLLLCSRDELAFEGESGALFERMAANLSVGLEALEKDEALRRFRLAFDSSADLVALVDRETMRFVDVNDTLCRALGYSREEMLSFTPDRVLPFGRAELEASYDALIAHEARQVNVRSHYICRDGSLLPFEATRHAIRSRGRWVIVGIGRDMRERLAAEEEARRKDAFFRSMVDNLSDAIGATDMDWRYLYVGPSARRVLGYEPEELVGRRFGDPTSAERAEAMRRELAARLEATGLPQTTRFPARYKDGRVRLHEVVVSKGSGPDGKPIYVITGRDVTERIEAERKLAEREQELRALVSNTPDVIARWSPELRCLFVSDAVERVTGRPAASIIGRRLDEMDEPESFTRVVRENCRRVFETGVGCTAEFTYALPERVLHYEMRLVPEPGPDGRVATVLMINRDLTERVRAEEEIRKREEEFRAVAENAPDGIMRFDRELRCLYANKALTKTSGHPAEWFLGRRLAEFELPEELQRGLEAVLRQALESGATQAFDYVFHGPRGERHYQARIAPELGPDGSVASVLGVSRDVTDRRRFEQQIEHLATHDRLTGLPNRALLGDRVEQAILQAKRSGGALALLFVDLDQFKLVNDSFGHLAGDALLVEVASRLRATVREGDTVARLGGDEFVVLLTSLVRPDDSSLVARKIAEALDRPIVSPAGELRVTASIGIALYPEDGGGLEALLQCADAAMYRAKDAGRNAFQYYSAEMGEQARARVETEAGLRRALERQEFRLHYQPQVDLATGAVTGFEALLRWEHPERGVVSPAAFIPVAEESGLILPIGQWALHTACREAAGWSAAGRPVKVSVNLSARQFWRGSVTELVRSALAESGLPAALLELEITESVVARDLQQVTLTLEQLRRMGVTVAIDDFGTGYSSLAYLRSLPIQKLKVDKSFIHGIPADSEATALVGEIIRLAHVLSLAVVAEGVETAEQARYLREAGCEAMQGYLFARPLPAPEALAFLRAGRRFPL